MTTKHVHEFMIVRQCESIRKCECGAFRFVDTSGAIRGISAESNHEIFMWAQTYLQDLAEIYWFRGENESTKGETARAEHYVRQYHAVHDIMRALEVIDGEQK